MHIGLDVLHLSQYTLHLSENTLHLSENTLHLSQDPLHVDVDRCHISGRSFQPLRQEDLSCSTFFPRTFVNRLLAFEIFDSNIFCVSYSFSIINEYGNHCQLRQIQPFVIIERLRQIIETLIALRLEKLVQQLYIVSNVQLFHKLFRNLYFQLVVYSHHIVKNCLNVFNLRWGEVQIKS